MLNYFDRLIPLTKEEKELVTAKFHPRLFRKHQYILQEGMYALSSTLLSRAVFGMYKIDDQRNTHILQFAGESYLINDLGSFHSVKPSALNIDVLEDTVVLQINHNKLISIYKQAPKFDRIFEYL